MVVDMLGVDMRGNDRLHIVTKHLADKCHAYLVSELGRDVLRIRKTHYVVDRLDGAFAAFARRCIIAASCILLVNRLHLRVGELGLGHAV